MPKTEHVLENIKLKGPTRTPLRDCQRTPGRPGPAGWLPLVGSATSRRRPGVHTLHARLRRDPLGWEPVLQLHDHWQLELEVQPLARPGAVPEPRRLNTSTSRPHPFGHGLLPPSFSLPSLSPPSRPSGKAVRSPSSSEGTGNGGPKCDSEMFEMQ
jgi:hypothetical protein